MDINIDKEERMEYSHFTLINGLSSPSTEVALKLCFDNGSVRFDMNLKELEELERTVKEAKKALEDELFRLK
jgi:hypothetical protein